MTTDRRISWEHENSCTLDSGEDVERWQNRLHEVTTLNCSMMVRSLCCVTIEERELLTYDGLTVVDGFLSKFENTVLESSDLMHEVGTMRNTYAMVGYTSRKLSGLVQM